MCASTHATLRLGGDALVPDAVSAALGVRPSQAFEKGEQRQDRVRQRTGVWLLTSEAQVDSTSLERHLIFLLDLVEPAAVALVELKRRQDFSLDFFCFWVSAKGHGGPIITPRTLGRISSLDAEFGIDFYAP